MRHSPAAKPDTPLRNAGLLIVVVAIFATLYIARDVFIPIALAIFLTFILRPLADWIERWHLPRVVASVSVVIVVCVLLLGLTYVVGNQFATFARDLDLYKVEIGKKIKVLRGSDGGMFTEVAEAVGHIQRDIAEPAATQSTTAPSAAAAARAAESTSIEPQKDDDSQRGKFAGAVGGELGRAAVGEPVATPTPGEAKSNPIYVSNVDSGPLSGLAGWAGAILGPLGTIGLVLVLALFMLLERDDLRDRLIRLSSRGRYTITTQTLNDATTRIGKYLRAQLIVNGTYGIAVAIGLYLIGLIFGNGPTFPSFILFGFLCGVLRFIPYIGPWIAAAFPIAVSLAVYPGFGVFTATVTMFVVIELISNNFMEPMLYGHTTGISTVALFVAAILWTFIWGPYGLLMATPITVCLVVLGRHVSSLSFLDVMLGDRPALPAGDRFYQRLLAGNGKDAEEIAHEYADEHGTIAAADQVVMPAIRMARQDRRTDDLTADDEAKLYRTADDILARAHDADREAAADAEGKVHAAETYGHRPLVIGLPAHHRAESIAVALVARLVEPIGARVEPLSCSLLPADVEAGIEAARPAAVFIAVVPPGGATQARYLCRRLSRKFKDLPIVVGYFGTFRDFDALLVRFRASGATHVTTSIGQSRLQLVTLLRLKISPDVERAQSGPLEAPRAAATVPPETRVDDVPLRAGATAEVRR